MFDLFDFFVQAQCDPNGPFGCLNSPVPIGQGNDPAAGVSSLFTVIIRSTITVAAILTLVYLLWGGFDWIVSGGDKEKMVKAQQKITYALIGIAAVVLAFSVFAVIAGNVLGLITLNGGTFQFHLPTFNTP